MIDVSLNHERSVSFSLSVSHSLSLLISLVAPPSHSFSLTHTLSRLLIAQDVFQRVHHDRETDPINFEPSLIRLSFQLCRQILGVGVG